MQVSVEEIRIDVLRGRANSTNRNRELDFPTPLSEEMYAHIHERSRLNVAKGENGKWPDIILKNTRC